jgi:hypothetical protein
MLAPGERSLVMPKALMQTSIEEKMQKKKG